MDGPPQEQIDLTGEQVLINRLTQRIAQMVVALEILEMKLEGANALIRQLGYDPMTNEPLPGEPSHNVQS